MKKYLIEGGNELAGTIRISGSKNVVTKAVIAACLTSEPVTLKNVPEISDIHALLEVIESIGGIVDAKEDPFEAAKRELLEETGLVADTWVLWDAVQMSEKIDWAVYTLIAKNCHRQQEVHLDAGEKIQLIEVSFDEFVSLAAEPNFRDYELGLKIFQAQKNLKTWQETQQLFGVK